MKTGTGFRKAEILACMFLIAYASTHAQPAYAISPRTKALFRRVIAFVSDGQYGTSNTSISPAPGAILDSSGNLMVPTKSASAFITQASWYGGKFHGRPTASGEIYDQNSLTAASPDLPFGTKVLVKNPANGKTVTVVINDRGPFVAGRGIDLSRAAAQQLGITGVSPVICYADTNAPGGFRTVHLERTANGGYRFKLVGALKKVVAKIKRYVLD